MTPFLAWVKEYLQKILTQRIMILSLEILTQRIDYCEQKYDSKNWTFESVTRSTEPSFSIWVNESNPLFQYESKNWTFFFFKKKKYDSKNWTFFEFWLKEFNFFENDAKNRTFFLGYDAKIDPFLLNFDNKELNFLFKNDSMNWIWLKGLNLFF